MHLEFIIKRKKGPISPQEKIRKRRWKCGGEIQSKGKSIFRFPHFFGTLPRDQNDESFVALSKEWQCACSIWRRRKFQFGPRGLKSGNRLRPPAKLYRLHPPLMLADRKVLLHSWQQSINFFPPPVRFSHEKLLTIVDVSSEGSLGHHFKF